MAFAPEKTPAGAILMDGNIVANEIQTNLAKRLASNPQANVTLATVLIGENPASKLYIDMKRQRAAAVGIRSNHIQLAETVSMQETDEKVTALVADPTIHGILIQLPLPAHLNAREIINLLPAEKDVDGLTDINLGKLLCSDPQLVPCTPLGIMRLLEHYKIPTRGRHAVIIGRSALVGLPMSLLLSRRGIDTTVTLAHSYTEDLPKITRSADILIVATGTARMITAQHIKAGASVFDVGVTKTAQGVQGDVDFDDAQSVAGAITPMPGGTGPVTVACLLENTVRAAELQNVSLGGYN